MAAGIEPVHTPRGRASLRRLRFTLDDGAQTTVHVATHDVARTRLRIVRLREPQRLAVHCAVRGIEHALVGGFFTRFDGTPLGELRTAGSVRPHTPFDAPWAQTRACVHVHGDEVRVARRDDLPFDPAGDLLQAGPLLVREGGPVLSDGDDPEGFSSAAHQFDSDITAGRYPRAALGLAGGTLLAVAADGRSRDDAGLTLAELADVLVSLGAHTALNLDGGGSASLVHAGRLRNRPRAENGVELFLGRPIATALIFEPSA